MSDDWGDEFLNAPSNLTKTSSEWETNADSESSIQITETKSEDKILRVLLKSIFFLIFFY